MSQIISFPGLGFSVTIDPNALCIGDFCIKWYGVLFAAAFLCGTLYAIKNAKKFGLDEDRMLDVLLGAIVCGVIGARLYYVAFSWERYRNNPIEILYLWNGGIAIYGGVIGAILGGVILCKLRRVKTLPMLDLCSAGLILAQGIGRWGNFCNGEAFGSATTLPWRMNVAYASGTGLTQVQEYLLTLPSDQIMEMGGIEAIGVHPTFFYESVWCILGFVLLWKMRDHRKFDGQLILTYTIWYGAERFVVEGLRTDSLMIGNLRVSQIVALVSAITAAIVMMVVLSKKKAAHDPEYLKLYVETEEAQLIREGKFYLKKEKKTEISAENEENTEENTQENAGSEADPAEETSVKAEKTDEEA